MLSCQPGVGQAMARPNMARLTEAHLHGCLKLATAACLLETAARDPDQDSSAVWQIAGDAAAEPSFEFLVRNGAAQKAPQGLTALGGIKDGKACSERHAISCSNPYACSPED